MSFEREQERLLELWRDVETDEEAIGSESEDEPEDHVSDRSGSLDTEQEVSDEDFELPDVQVNNRFLWGKDRKTKWTEYPRNVALRTRQENIIRTKLPCPKLIAKAAKSPLECWSLFIDEVMLNSVVVYTNQTIALKSANYGDRHMVQETNLAEIKAVLGLLYLAGLFRSGRQNLEDLWASDGTGVDIFRATMPLKRFQFLLACLRFDDRASRTNRRSLDKLAPIRAIFDRFVDNCQQSEYVTIDEKLEEFCGRCGFRQYIPNKPAKYGIKVFALVDSKTFYVVNLEVYLGQQPEGPFRLSNKPEDVVLRLVEPIVNSRRNVTFDNWFTSYPLVVKLLNEYQLTSIGTIKKNKKEIPPQLLAVRNRELKSSQFAFQPDVTLVSYIPKKGKNVLLISTLHHGNEIDPDSGDLLKPEMITFYNQTKGAVDVVDELSGTYNVSRNNRRWPLTLFFSLLNSSAINAMVINNFNNSDAKLKRRVFLRQLGLSLIRPFQNARLQNPHVRRELRQKISDIHQGTSSTIEVPLGEPAQKWQKFSRRCYLCPRNIDRKSFYTCSSCNRCICLSHGNQICDDRHSQVNPQE